MKTLSWMLLVLSMLTFISCLKKQNLNEKIVAKFDTTDFAQFKDRSIYLRSTTFSVSIYFINTYESNCGPYVVEYDFKNKTVVSIKNSLVIKSCDVDYLGKKEIVSLVNEFVKYDIRLLQVDKEGNVYINPAEDGPAKLLRKAHLAKSQDINRFTPFRGNWYIRK